MAVYDYGAGKTYATPQAALDACQLANEFATVPQPFTEANYIRGYGSANYNNPAAGEPVLRLAHSVSGRGLLSTAAFPLYIDQNDQDLITLKDTEDAGGIVNGADDGTALASHVRIDLSRIIAAVSATSIGIATCLDRTGGETCEGWRVKVGALYSQGYGIVAGCLTGLAVENTVINGDAAAGIYADGGAGTYGAFKGVLSLINAAIDAAGPAVSALAEDALLDLRSASLRSTGDAAIQWNDDGASTWLGYAAVNSIVAAAAGEVCLKTDFANLQVLHSDGNCLYSDTGIADVDGDAIATLSAWRSRYDCDSHSQDADPLFAGPDLTLASNSPCLLTGIAATAAGIEGNGRAYAVDQGAYQSSDAAGWDLDIAGGRFRGTAGFSIGITGV